MSLFEGLNDDQLAALAGKFEVQEFDAGQSPVRTGQHGYAFFVLLSGEAHVEVDGEVVEKIEAGSLFGEMAFFAPNSRRTATVIADTTVRVLTQFGTEFRWMQVEFPEIAKRVEDKFKEHHARDEAREQN